ncbi:LPD7 domain-containing protein [Acidithiobacillus sulfuriphilus]|uniref:LPD7 domain-containing protein n=1 Tax=Acidithiobacillus sulfuriphilus TaxID=1867749 RepID=UPI003F5F1B37
MAPQPETATDPLFTYGPITVTRARASQDLRVHNGDLRSTSTFPQDDPLHREILSIIDKNPHSRGFVANQIQARITGENRWQGLDREDEGLSLGPSGDREIQQEPETPGVAETEKAQAPEVPERSEPARERRADPEPEKSVEPLPDPLANWPGQGQEPAPLVLPVQAPEKPRFERKSPPEVLFANPKGKPYVLDHGDKVTVTNRAMLGLGREAAEKRRMAVEVALKAAVDRFGEPVRFQGNRAFLEETVKVAMERGVALEPGSPMARDIYERALKERGNQLGPSKGCTLPRAAPYRAPEKRREIARSKGMGL